MNRFELCVALLVSGSVAAAPASLVKNINTLSPRVYRSNPFDFTGVGNSVYVSATDELHPYELWKPSL